MEVEHFLPLEPFFDTQCLPCREEQECSSYDSYFSSSGEDVKHRGFHNDVAQQVPTLFNNPTALQIARDDKVFCLLWSRIWRSERYRRYRLNQQKPSLINKNGEKWTDERELAFWMAVAKEVPRARKKEYYKGRSDLLGRNQSIAAMINELLHVCDENEKIDRKLVSSHLQVLKPYFRNDPFVTDYLQGDHTTRTTYPSSPTTNGRSLRQTHRRSTRHSRFGRDVYSRANHGGLAAQRIRRYARAPTLPSQDFRDDPTTLVEYLDFRMYSRDSTCKLQGNADHVCGPPSVCQYQYLHVFTESKEGAGMPDTRILDSQITKSFPELAQANEKRVGRCPIIFAEASLAIPTQDLRTDADVQLLIEGTVATRHQLDAENSWICRTTFYEGHSQKREFDQGINSICDNIEGLYRHSLPFASKFWADKLVEFTSMRHSAGDYAKDGGQSWDSQSFPSESSYKTLDGSGNDSKKAKELHDQISARVKSITARQEILAFPMGPKADSRPTTHLIILWKFRQTGSCEAGITQFRNLICEQNSSPDVDVDVDLSAAPKLDINLQYYQLQHDDCSGNATAGQYFLDEQTGDDISAAHPYPRDLDMLASAAAFTPAFLDDYVFAAAQPTQGGSSSALTGSQSVSADGSAGYSLPDGVFDAEADGSMPFGGGEFDHEQQLPLTQQYIHDTHAPLSNDEDATIVVAGLDENNSHNHHGHHLAIEAPVPASQAQLLAFIRDMETFDLNSQQQHQQSQSQSPGQHGLIPLDESETAADVAAAASFGVVPSSYPVSAALTYEDALFDHNRRHNHHYPAHHYQPYDACFAAPAQPGGDVHDLASDDCRLEEFAPYEHHDDDEDYHKNKNIYDSEFQNQGHICDNHVQAHDRGQYLRQQQPQQQRLEPGRGAENASAAQEQIQFAYAHVHVQPPAFDPSLGGGGEVSLTGGAGGAGEGVGGFVVAAGKGGGGAERETQMPRLLPSALEDDAGPVPSYFSVGFCGQEVDVGEQSVDGRALTTAMTREGSFEG